MNNKTFFVTLVACLFALDMIAQGFTFTLSIDSGGKYSTADPVPADANAYPAKGLPWNEIKGDITITAKGTDRGKLKAYVDFRPYSFSPGGKVTIPKANLSNRITFITIQDKDNRKVGEFRINPSVEVTSSTLADPKVDSKPEDLIYQLPIRSFNSKQYVPTAQQLLEGDDPEDPEMGNLVNYNIRYDLKNNIVYSRALSNENGEKERKRLVAGHNDMINFEVSNFNPLYYEITVNEEQIVYNVDVPSALEKFVTSKDTSGSSTTAGTNNSSSGATSLTTGDTINTSDEINTLIAHSDFAEMKPVLTALRDLGDLTSNLIQLNNELTDFYRSRTRLEFLDNELLRKEVNIIKDNIASKFGIDRFYLNNQVFEDTLEQVLDTKFTIFEKEVNDLTNDNLKGKLTGILQEFRTKYLPLSKKIAEIVNALNAVSYRAISYRIQPNGADVIRFDVEIKKKTETTPKKLNYEVMIRGGVKIDFSTGVFFSNLLDHNFTVSDTAFQVLGDSANPFNSTYGFNIANDTILTRNTISRNDEGSFNVGVASMAHIYIRTGSKIATPTLSVGLGFDQDQKIRYLGGAGVILGRQQRFIFSGGFVAGQVERLHSQLQGRPFYDGTQVSSTTSRVWEMGGFFGVTFNLTANRQQVQ